jgi:signal transduction histidine kinase
MEKHGGTLTLESEPGQGTRAIAVFPKDAVTSAPESAPRPARHAALAA